MAAATICSRRFSTRAASVTWLFTVALSDLLRVAWFAVFILQLIMPSFAASVISPGAGLQPTVPGKPSGLALRRGKLLQLALPQHFTQPEFLDLARCGRRHRLQYNQLFRNVLNREFLRLEKVDHGCEVDSFSRPEHDHRAGSLAQALVGIGDDSDLGDGGMLVEQRLHFNDRNVFAAADNDILAAAANADVAIRIHAGQIAGFEPTFRVRTVPLGPFQITAEIRTGAHDELADLPGWQCLTFCVDDLHLGPGQRATVGRRSQLIVIVHLYQRNGAVLRHTPGRDDFCPEACLRLLDEWARDRGSGT